MDFILGFFLLTLFLSSAELLLLLHVATAWGFAPTFALCLLTGLAGGWMVRRQGLHTLLNIQRSLGEGRLPAEEIVSGLVLLLLGAFLVVPGFITDAAGLALLFPPLRRLVARGLIHRFRNRINFRMTSPVVHSDVFDVHTVDSEVNEDDSPDHPITL